MIVRPLNQYAIKIQLEGCCFFLRFSTGRVTGLEAIIWLVANEVTENENCGHFYKHELSLIPAWISNYVRYNMWDEIAYPFQNFSDFTVEVWELISNYFPHFPGHVVTYPCWDYHYYDVIMGTIASQITSLTIVYSGVYSDADQSKHQSSASLAFVREIHRGPVNFPHKWPVTRKMFPFDDVIMIIVKPS